MDDDKKTLTIEVWDFWKLCPELPFIINKAVDEGLCITINYSCAHSGGFNSNINCTRND